MSSIILDSFIFRSLCSLLFVAIIKRNLKILSLKANHGHIMCLYAVIQGSALARAVVFRGPLVENALFEKITVKPRKTVRRLLAVFGQERY